MKDKKVIKDLKERNDKLKQQYDYNNIHLISLENRYNNLQQEKEELQKRVDKATKYINENTISEPLNEVSSGLFIGGKDEPIFLWELYNILVEPKGDKE